MALNQTRDTTLAVVSLTRQASTQAAELRCCEEIEAAVLGSPVPNKPYGFCGRKATVNNTALSELRSCEKVEAAILGSPSLISLKVSVDVKQH